MRRFDDALCRQTDADLWFPEQGGNTSHTARNICKRCPLVDVCAEAALDGGEQYGIWAGVNVGSDVTAEAKLRRLASGEDPVAVLSEKPVMRGKPRGIRNPRPVRHGTMSGYKHYRCRCDACRDAYNAYRKAAS